MKKIMILLSILLVAGLIALSGCEDKSDMKTGDSGSKAGSGSEVKDSGSDDSGPSTMDKIKAKASGKYTGFMEWEEGMWAEYIMPGNIRNTWSITKIDKEKIIFQMVVSGGGADTRVSQIWMDPDTKKAIKYVMDMNGQITCLEPADIPQDAVPKGDNGYPADFPNMRSDTYTTKTGKKVDAAVYDVTGLGEVWVSSEVPFGMVLTKTTQGSSMELYDFGTSGAKVRISESKAENCQSMEDLANSMMAGMANQDMYENYAQDEDSTLEAEATYRGQEQDIDCSMCDGMPQAARNACMASCGG